MTPLDTLAPDQRAVLELVLRQGRSYGELSELLGIPERDVRARADAGLRALAGEGEKGVDTGRIADWLLGQQPDAEAERTRTAVGRSPAAQAWAAAAAERLREMGGASVPEVPTSADAALARETREPSAARATRSPREAGEIASATPARPRPRPVRDGAAHPRDDAPAAATAAGGAPPSSATGSTPRPSATGSALRSSRLGGAILIAILVVAVGALIVFVVARGDDDSPSGGSQQSPTASATPTPAVTATGNDIVLQGTNGSKAVGLMRLLPGSKGTVQFAIAAQNVPANQGREVYAVWFTGDKLQPRRLGFAQAQVGQNGVLTTAGPQKRDMKAFPRWFATYQNVLITRETAAKATKPGPAVLEGKLPNGA
jgi:hypothetical protein